jgi:L-ribulokinase
VVPLEKVIADIPGICGIVPGAILPDFYGIEAGQSAVGDLFSWWVSVICGGDETLHATLMREAAQHKPGESGLLALDWNNGNRTILVDPLLSGLILGCTLHTSRAEIYRALIEATAFGARAIIERIREHGVTVDRIVCAGGVAEKNALLMRIYADAIGCTLQVASSSQACALGAAIAAAVICGAHADFPAAQRAMVSLKKTTFRPRARSREVYDRLYGLYRQLHDSFGGLTRSADLSHVMKDLIDIKQSAAPLAIRATRAAPSATPATRSATPVTPSASAAA